MKTFIITLGLLLFVPACASFVRNPDTGEYTVDPAGVAKDLRAGKILIEEVSAPWKEASPSFYAAAQNAVVSLESAAVAFDAIDQGAEPATATEYIEAALDALDVLADFIIDDEETQRMVDAAIGSARASLRLVEIYSQ